MPWLIRISDVFADLTGDIAHGLGADITKPLNGGMLLTRMSGTGFPRDSECAAFVRWNLPVDHAWPCNPEKMPGFVEKAAQAIQRKFGERRPQAIFAGPLDGGGPHGYFRTLASNLRGRTLQLFPAGVAELRDPEQQDPDAPSLFCMVGREGLFCGMQSPRDSNGFFPGGTRFIGRDAEDTISRAGAKIAEALHFLPLHRPVPAAGSHWLELGASPGGMTAELLRRGYRVTAVDRAPLDRRLNGRPGLTFVGCAAGDFSPPANVQFDALLSDMNGSPRQALRETCRLAKYLSPSALVVFTLKMANATNLVEMQTLVRDAVETAAASGLELVAKTHLSYNRRELTLFYQTVERVA